MMERERRESVRVELAFGKLASVPAQAYLPRKTTVTCVHRPRYGNDFREDRGAILSRMEQKDEERREQLAACCEDHRSVYMGIWV